MTSGPRFDELERERRLLTAGSAPGWSAAGRAGEESGCGSAEATGPAGSGRGGAKGAAAGVGAPFWGTAGSTPGWFKREFNTGCAVPFSWG